MGLPLLLRLIAGSTVLVLVTAPVIFISLAIAQIVIPSQIGISSRMLLAIALIATWGIAFCLLGLIALSNRRPPRQEGFDVLPPKSE